MPGREAARQDGMQVEQISYELVDMVCHDKEEK